eukprot:TRINITY_DN123_c2_g1_i1.p1 TRINITY_DN123_c2_g1~~TRINITY_DN123_c2_g1_i1.p1  ORF type:complete len:376 (-),score=96.11 TRINITY_DN123_c2_g1_i1:193-1281(-)
MSITLQRLSVCITAHSWNADRTRLALCPNNNEIWIFKRNGNSYVREDVLKEHDNIVTAVSWAPNSNRILSCSHDRNAYVWTPEGNSWKPMLVLLRLNRGATCCSWSPKEDKFAVGSASNAIAVCYFESENQWWVSKHIKTGITSSITCLDWHPNNILLAAGGTQSEAHVFSGFVRGVDSRQSVAGGTPFGDKLPFGTHLSNWATGGWVHAIHWSPSGNQLAFTTHDSTNWVIEASTKQHQINVSKHQYLPFRDLLWVDEQRFVAVGHDCNPTLIVNKGGQWVVDRQLDQKKKAAGPAGGFSARNMWESKVSKGTTDSAATATALNTRHQNSICEVKAINGNMFSTVGLDGNLGVWPYAAVQM